MPNNPVLVILISREKVFLNVLVSQRGTISKPTSVSEQATYHHMIFWRAAVWKETMATNHILAFAQGKRLKPLTIVFLQAHE